MLYQAKGSQRANALKAVCPNPGRFVKKFIVKEVGLLIIIEVHEGPSFLQSGDHLTSRDDG